MSFQLWKDKEEVLRKNNLLQKNTSMSVFNPLPSWLEFPGTWRKTSQEKSGSTARSWSSLPNLWETLNQVQGTNLVSPFCHSVQVLSSVWPFVCREWDLSVQRDRTEGRKDDHWKEGSRGERYLLFINTFRDIGTLQWPLLITKLNYQLYINVKHVLHRA